MTIDSGGWTLVWQYSYIKDLPISTKMYYFSDYYKGCTIYGSAWCNIPNKKRFDPTEQMIIAYHNKQIIYAYKGMFNFNIDHDWTGGILVNFNTKIADQCSLGTSQGTLPAPSLNAGNDISLFGLAFDKYSPHDYCKNSDTIYMAVSVLLLIPDFLIALDHLIFEGVSKLWQSMFAETINCFLKAIS